MKNFDLIKDVNCLGNFKDRTKLFEDLISYYALEMKSCGENEFCMQTEIGTISVYLYEGEVVLIIDSALEGSISQLECKSAVGFSPPAVLCKD